MIHSKSASIDALSFTEGEPASLSELFVSVPKYFYEVGDELLSQMKTCNGKDKSLRLIQYSCKFYCTCMKHSTMEEIRKRFE